MWHWINSQWSYNERGRPLENPNLFNSKGFCLQLFTRENLPKKCSSSIMLCFLGSNSHKTLVKLEWQSSVPSMKNRGAPVNITAFPFILWDPRLWGGCCGIKNEPLSLFLSFCVFVSLKHTHTRTQNAMRSFGMGHLYWIGIEGLEILSGLQNSAHSMATMIMTLRYSRKTERKKGEGMCGPLRNQPNVLQEWNESVT